MSPHGPQVSLQMYQESNLGAPLVRCRSNDVCTFSFFNIFGEWTSRKFILHNISLPTLIIVNVKHLMFSLQLDM